MMSLGPDPKPFLLYANFGLRVLWNTVLYNKNRAGCAKICNAELYWTVLHYLVFDFVFKSYCLYCIAFGYYMLLYCNVLYSRCIVFYCGVVFRIALYVLNCT